MCSRYLVARLRFSNSVKFCSSRALCKNLIRLTLNSWDNWCKKAFLTETQRCRVNSKRKIIIKMDKKLDKIELQNVKSDWVQFKLMLKSSFENKVFMRFWKFGGISRGFSDILTQSEDFYSKLAFFSKIKICHYHDSGIRYWRVLADTGGWSLWSNLVLICHILIFFLTFDPEYAWISLIRAFIVKLCKTVFFDMHEKFLYFFINNICLNLVNPEQRVKN